MRWGDACTAAWASESTATGGFSLSRSSQYFDVDHVPCPGLMNAHFYNLDRISEDIPPTTPVNLDKGN